MLVVNNILIYCYWIVISVKKDNVLGGVGTFPDLLD